VIYFNATLSNCLCNTFRKAKCGAVSRWAWHLQAVIETIKNYLSHFKNAGVVKQAFKYKILAKTGYCHSCIVSLWSDGIMGFTNNASISYSVKWHQLVCITYPDCMAVDLQYEELCIPEKSSLTCNHMTEKYFLTIAHNVEFLKSFEISFINIRQVKCVCIGIASRL
jgi:hypothetical protein